MADDYTPLELRRGIALQDALRTAGLWGTDTAPVAFLTRTSPNTVVPTFRDTATAQQRTQANGIISGWDWSQAADLAANPPASVTMSQVTGLADALTQAMAEATAAKNMAQAANLPYWANQVVTDANGRFTATLPDGLFGASVKPVVVHGVEVPDTIGGADNPNKDRPHTCNLRTVTNKTVTGYVTYIRPLPADLIGKLLAALLTALNAYDTTRPAAGVVVHLRAGFPKTN